MTKQNKIFLLLGASAAIVTVALLISKKEKGFTEKITDKGLDIVDKIGKLINKGKNRQKALFDPKA